ncbi:MAG: hypothetical protein AAF267_02185 [Deinococcota bacterium]
MTEFEIFWQALQEILLPFAPLLNSPLPLMLPLLFFLLGSFDPRDARAAKQVGDSKQADGSANLKRRRYGRRRSENNLKIQISIWSIVLAIYYNFIGTLNSSIYISVILGIAAINIDKLVYFLRFNAYSNTRARAERLVGEDSVDAYLAEADLLEAELTHRNVSSITTAKIRATVGSSRRILSSANPDLDWLQGQLEEARVLLRLPSSEEIALLRTFFFFVASLSFIVFQFVVAGYAFDPLFVTTVLRVEFFGVPAVLIIWSAIGSVASLLNEYVSDNGSIVGDSRSLFFKPILSVILSSISFFAITALFPTLFGDGSGEGTSGLVGIIGIDDPGRFRAQFAFLSVFGFLTGFYEELSYNFLLEAKKRFNVNKTNATNSNTGDVTIAKQPEVAPRIEVDNIPPTTQPLEVNVSPPHIQADATAYSHDPIDSPNPHAAATNVTDIQPQTVETLDTAEAQSTTEPRYEGDGTAQSQLATPSHATPSQDAALSAAAFAVKYRRLRQASRKPSVILNPQHRPPTSSYTKPLDAPEHTPSASKAVASTTSQPHAPSQARATLQPTSQKPPSKDPITQDDASPNVLLKELEKYQNSPKPTSGSSKISPSSSRSSKSSN